MSDKNWLKGDVGPLVTRFAVVVPGVQLLMFLGALQALGAMADIFAVLQANGWLSLLYVSLLGAGSVLLSAQGQKKQANRGAQLVAASWLLIAAAFVGMYPAASRTVDKQQAELAAPTSSQAPATTTSAVPSGVPVQVGSGCPLPDPTDPVLPPIDVKVVYWCKAEAYDLSGELDQRNYQIKVRPRLVNNTGDTLDVSVANASRIRLLVSGPQVDQRWSPPPLTREHGDRPLLVDCNGGKFWAIPPNVPRDAAPTPTGYYTGYVSSWDRTTLGPGEVAFTPLTANADGRPVQRGNLVFQVPLDELGQARIYGLAVIDPTRDNRVLGVAVFGQGDQWGQALVPTSF